MAADKSNNEPDLQNRQVAFLIVDGSQVVLMDQQLTNIGRKADNHIVINNEHVSRYHAQIRRIQKQYIIHDLNSTVGTSVNGKRVEQKTLTPGDIISLGGVPLIFGEGTPITEFDSLNNKHEELVDSGPTENTDIQSADEYLDLFNAKKDG